MSDEHRTEPFVNAMSLQIAKVGLVVHDAVQTAKQYAALFGVGPWIFHDLEPSLSVLEGKPVPPGPCGVRVARARLGDKRLELLQPLYGASCPMAHLWERGEGIHHLGLGALDDYDEVLARLREGGVNVETEGELGGRRFAQFGSWEQLGVLFDISEPGAPIPPSWGQYKSPGAGVVDTAGKRMAQLGIVTGDMEAMARRYWEWLGIGPWALFDWEPPVGSAEILHGVAVEPGAKSHLRAAICDHPSMQIELIEPMSGPSTHMDYLRRHGPGSHHLSFDIIDDRDEFVSGLGKEGVEIEMSGLAGAAYEFTYVATRRQLATVWEVLRFFPDEDESAGLYGIFPPLEEGA